MQLSNQDLTLVANTIRGLAMDAVQQANSGHPGMPMGMADAATVLWTEFLCVDPVEPHWHGRDRFVLSAGHGSMLLYSLLHLSGHGLSMDDLRQFRQLHSRTPGHPEVGETAGVETTTGPLGQGFANGVGMALAARMEASRFGHAGLCARVFGIVSDGDLMEGISAEAAALAGHLKLSNLVFLYDDNRITIEGRTDLAFTEDVTMRFRACGWDVHETDGHDFASVRAALVAATNPANTRPQLVRCRTTIGKGSPNKADSHKVHGEPLGTDEVRASKAALGMPDATFHVDPRVYELFRARAATCRKAREQWQRNLDGWLAAQPDRAREWRAYSTRAVPADLYDQLRTAAGDEEAATRVLSGKVIQKAAELVPSLVGGSADLDPSTKTRITKSSSVTGADASGRNLHFGIREHAMGGMLNGMALYGGALPMGSTFLVFADYCRPAIRLSALMKLPVTWVFTHDSIMVGEDGPTHQPVEQLASLRVIPNLHVWRPADGLETAAAWSAALVRRDGPTLLSLTRQNLPKLTRSASFQPLHALRGGYVLQDAADAKATLVATGAEVGLAVAAAAELAKRSLPVRVVSMPCVEVFVAQDAAWRAAVLPKALPTFAVEMGRPEPWCRFTGSIERVVGLTGFGASAPHKKLAEHFGFTPTAVADRIASQLG